LLHCSEKSLAFAGEFARHRGGGAAMTGHVITVAQQKGGSGKTTLTANLALHFAGTGKSVAVLDTDPQGSLGRWFMSRLEKTGGKPGFDFGTASAWGVSYECEKLRQQHDLVFIDTPPKIDADLRPALREADLVLIPIATSHVDLWATESVLELARREDRPVLAVLNRVSARARLTAEVRAEDGRDGAGTRPERHMGNRVAYAEGLGDGSAIFERSRRGPGVGEIAALAKEISEKLGC
jgi:chromosome partitioning protein